MFRVALNWISDLLWPLTCIGCKTTGTRLCNQCMQGLPQQPHVFLIGALRIHARGTMEHPLLSRAIWCLKYRNAPDLAVPLGNVLPTVVRIGDNPRIVPIPLHASRLRERGYNQAELLARQLSLTSAFPLSLDVLVRIRKTTSQVESKSRQARLENMRHAFCVPHPELIANRDIILVDDVCTTGATLQAAATALRAAGARSVTGIVLARG